MNESRMLSEPEDGCQVSWTEGGEGWLGEVMHYASDSLTVCVIALWDNGQWSKRVSDLPEMLLDRDRRGLCFFKANTHILYDTSEPA